MEVRPGYKQSEVGVIPDDWYLDYIENFAVITTGSKNTQDRVEDGNYPFFVRSQTVERINSYSFDGEAVLTAGDGVGTGKVFHYINGRFDVHQRVYRISNFAQSVNGYFFYLNFSTHFFKRIMQMTAKSSVDSVRRDMISRMQVALPPTETEQRSISGALSDVDALLDSIDRLIAKKLDLKLAAMQQLLTGQTRLPGFNGEWEEKRLADVATFYKGKGLPKSALSELGAEQCIHYGELFTRYKETISHIFSRTDASDSMFRSVANDVLMPTSDVTPRGLAKASCVTVDGAILGGDILVIRSDKNHIHGPFLSLVIRYEETQVLQLVTGSTVYHLYGRDMKNFTFSIPSIREQAAIAEMLTQMDAELTALEQRRSKTAALKQGMMQELLTGRTRLV
jgi:type I restriction enzyme S subunit